MRGAGSSSPDEVDRTLVDQVASIPGATGRFSKARVVIVDDDPSNSRLLDGMLRMAGATDIHCVTDARQAVNRCLDLHADLVLLDIHMPHVDGHAVLRALRLALAPDDFLPVLVLSGDTTTNARERALDAGANDFVTKPFDLVEVMQRAGNLLELRAMQEDLRHRNELLRAELEATGGERRRAEEDVVRRRHRIEHVLATGGVHVSFQPIVGLSDGRLVAVEALARFDVEPDRPPSEWFAEAADVGLDLDLELAAVRAAVAQLHRLPDDVYLSVNASPKTASTGALAGLLTGAGRGRVVVELTEHTPVDDYQRLSEAIRSLRETGILVAVDDMGAGYAGLRQILDLRPDIIKLDLELTRNVDTDPVRRALASSLVTFAADTDTVLVAEGIETRSELDALKGLGIQWGQGFLLARPSPLPIRTEFEV